MRPDYSFYAIYLTIFTFALKVFIEHFLLNILR